MGSLFLLHFSSDRSGRALPVILALWSPDFPHEQAFALSPQLSGLLAGSIVQDGAGKVNRGFVTGGTKGFKPLGRPCPGASAAAGR